MVRLILGPKAGEHLNRTVGAELRVRKEIVRGEPARHAPAAETSLRLVRDSTRIGRLKRAGAEPVRQPAALTLGQRVVDKERARTYSSVMDCLEKPITQEMVEKVTKEYWRDKQ